MHASAARKGPFQQGAHLKHELQELRVLRVGRRAAGRRWAGIRVCRLAGGRCARPLCKVSQAADDGADVHVVQRAAVAAVQRRQRLPAVRVSDQRCQELGVDVIWAPWHPPHQANLHAPQVNQGLISAHAAEWLRTKHRDWRVGSD